MSDASYICPLEVIMRQKNVRVVVMCVAALTGCGGPHLSIEAPHEGAHVTTAPDKSVPVDVAVSGIHLAAPGECGQDEACGHLRLRLMTVDRVGEDGSIGGVQCHQPGKEFNNVSAESPIRALLAHCPRQTGEFQATVSLHKDDGSMLENNVGGHTERLRFTVDAVQ